VNGDGKNFIVVTGANTGGKSTFLRSLGLAQLMMQAGMFVPANNFSAEVRGAKSSDKRRSRKARRSRLCDDEQAVDP
jgi:AAA15 family ATPase/GTPase